MCNDYVFRRIYRLKLCITYDECEFQYQQAESSKYSKSVTGISASSVTVNIVNSLINVSTLKEDNVTPSRKKQRTDSEFPPPTSEQTFIIYKLKH